MSFLMISVLSLGLQFSSNQNFEFWIQQLRNHSVDLRINALQKLGEIRDPSALPYLEQSLKSEDPQVRYYTARALGRHTFQPSMEILSNRLVREDDVYVKGEIRRSISLLKDYFSKMEAETPRKE